MPKHKLGCLPDDPSIPRVKLAAHLSPTATIPASVNWGQIPSIGMLLNDQWGDCVWASDGHICEILSYHGQGNEVTITDATVLAGYETTGFDPNAGPSGDNPTDRGSLLQQGLGYLVSQGMEGVKINAYAEIDVKNVNEIKLAIAELGPIDLALDLPACAEVQAQEGEPWAIVNDPMAMQIIGGHCVTGVGYDDQYLYIHTWGQEVKVEWSFFLTFFNQAFALVSREWVDAKSTLDPEHVNLETLGAEYASITGKRNPFSTVPAPGKKPSPWSSIWTFIRKLFNL